MTWHPILTAPSFRRVLVWWRDGAFTTAYMTPDTPAALAAGGATHWALPDPPAELAQDSA